MDDRKRVSSSDFENINDKFRLFGVKSQINDLTNLQNNISSVSRDKSSIESPKMVYPAPLSSLEREKKQQIKKHNLMQAVKRRLGNLKITL